ncbi:MAG: class I SAM-dependent methyltransferase [Chloroflexota bacterium]
MYPEWQTRLIDQRTGNALTFLGEVRNGSWRTGLLHGSATEPAATVDDGIVDFVGRSIWPDDALDSFGGWAGVERLLAANWNKGIPAEWFTAATREALTGELGLIVELAAGPGGGNLPWLLRLSPQARVLVNDIERRIVAGWQRFLAGGAGPNASFAVFDGLLPPLRDGAVDWVSTAAGFSEMSGGDDDPSAVSAKREQAVRQAFRILRPGGRLVAVETILGLPGGQQMPVPAVTAPLGQVLLGQRPWDETLTRAGFIVDRCELVFSRLLGADESDLQAEADRYSMQLETRMYAIEARKPA